MADSSPLLRLHGVTKFFGAHPALTDVGLELHAGEVLGIVGENGAGKSTLVKTLAGAHLADRGGLEMDGRPADLRSPADSIAAGVAVIYQELTIVPELSVAENLFLGQVPRRGGSFFLDRREMNRRAGALLDSLGLKIDPRTRAGDLAPGWQQMVEIGRAVNRRARVVLMDEPTSYLSDTEIARLFAFIRQLKGQGLGLIYISHHLEEIFEVCDRVMVLRDGRTVGTRPVAGWSTPALVQAMVNRSIEQFYPYRPRPLGEVALAVRDLVAPPRLHGVSFEARRGEIVGVAGVVGSGRSELLKILFGALPYQGGEIHWQGRPFRPGSPGHAIRRRLALVPEDRKLEGLMLDASIENNVSLSVLGRLARHGFVSFGEKRRLSEEGIRQFNVNCRGPGMTVRHLSGGNQQKVVFARTSATGPQLLLLDEPTRGVDVGAKVEVYKQIFRFAEEGCTVLLVSSELPELLGLSDRVLVLNGGRVVGDLPRDAATHERVLHLSTDENAAALAAITPDHDRATSITAVHAPSEEKHDAPSRILGV